MFKDYYRILGIEKNSNNTQIKKAFYTKSKICHPDKNPGRDTTFEMQDIIEAYLVLKNKQSRFRYDQEYSVFEKVHNYYDNHTDEDYEIKDDYLKSLTNEIRTKIRKSSLHIITDLRGIINSAYNESKTEVLRSIKFFLIYLVIIIIVLILLFLMK